jgi:hypothetical protein
MQTGIVARTKHRTWSMHSNMAMSSICCRAIYLHSVFGAVLHQSSVGNELCQSCHLPRRSVPSGSSRSSHRHARSAFRKKFTCSTNSMLCLGCDSLQISWGCPSRQGHAAQEIWSTLDPREACRKLTSMYACTFVHRRTWCVHRPRIMRPDSRQ